MAGHDHLGRFCRQKPPVIDTSSESEETDVEATCSEDCSVLVEHNYVGCHNCPGLTSADSCPACGGPDVSDSGIHYGVKIKRDSWRYGRRVIELSVLLDNLAACVKCRLGPIPLLHTNIIGEMMCGLGGYIYVQCQNPDCLHVNCVAYGSLHSKPGEKKKSCFTVNTKLGLGMYDLYS